MIMCVQSFVYLKAKWMCSFLTELFCLYVCSWWLSVMQKIQHPSSTTWWRGESHAGQYVEGWSCRRVRSQSHLRWADGSSWKNSDRASDPGTEHWSLNAHMQFSAVTDWNVLFTSAAYVGPRENAFAKV